MLIDQARIIRLVRREGVLQAVMSPTSKHVAHFAFRGSGAFRFDHVSMTLTPIAGGSTGATFEAFFEAARGHQPPVRLIGDGRIEFSGFSEAERSSILARLAVRTDEWGKLEPAIVQAVPLNYRRSLTELEWSILSAGRIPESMDDKWFVACVGDRVRFWRSWTGMLVFEVRVEVTRGAELVEAWVDQRFDDELRRNVHRMGADSMVTLSGLIGMLLKQS